MPRPEGPQFKHYWGELSPKLSERHNDDFDLPVTALALGTEDDPMAEFQDAYDLPVSGERVNIGDIASPNPVSSGRVQRAMEGYRDSPSSVPPVLLVKRAGTYEIADGHHRVSAARRLRKDRISAWVVHSPHDKPWPGVDY